MMQAVTPELEQWYTDNRARGCVPAQLRQSMLEAGYDAGFVEHFIASRTEPQPAPPSLDDAPALPSLEAWWRRCDELATRNSVWLGDREARIAGRCATQGIFYLRNVLADAECDALVADSESRIQGSTVVDPATGAFVPHPHRTSRGTHFERGATPVVVAIENRLAALSGLPEVNGEGLQILHYEVGGEYRPHFDYFDPATAGSAAQLELGGQRLLTIILYLNDVEGGGGTIFPELGLEFLPEKGAALLFASLSRGGELEKRSLHGGSPVTAGNKWIATRWIRLGPFRRVRPT